MTTRRGFLKGMVAAVGVVVARPKLPFLPAPALEPNMEVVVGVMDRLPPLKPFWPMEVDIGRGSWRILDNFGISADAVGKRIAELDMTVTGR